MRLILLGVNGPCCLECALGRVDCNSAGTLDDVCKERSDTMLHVANVDDSLRQIPLWGERLIVFLAIEAAVIMLLIYSLPMCSGCLIMPWQALAPSPGGLCLSA